MTGLTNLPVDLQFGQQTLAYVDFEFSFDHCPFHSMTDCMTCAVPCAVPRLVHLANSCFSNVSNQKAGYSTARQYECSGA